MTLCLRHSTGLRIKCRQEKMQEDGGKTRCREAKSSGKDVINNSVVDGTAET